MSAHKDPRDEAVVALLMVLTTDGAQHTLPEETC